MRLKFTQPTLGIKYARITAVTTTTITIKLLGTTVLSNEAITLPFYSTDYAPNQLPSPDLPDPKEAFVTTAETTSSSTYTDLTTTTDSVTVTIGSSGFAILNLYSSFNIATTSAIGSVSFVASGANTIAVSDTYAIQYQAPTNANNDKKGASHLLTGLTPGSTTFKLKYKSGSGNITFADRRISVIPL